MSCVSATGSKRRAPQRAAGALCVSAALALVLALVGLAGCSSSKSSGGGGGSRAGAAGEKDVRNVLLTRKGESSIQVTESTINGNQIVRINTVFRGEENSIVLDIDQPVYEVEIPLTLDQVIPQASSAQVRGPEGQFQDLLIAQWLQKAQEAMLAGDYNGALRQVDTVLQVQPNHTQAHSMKGSVYYALGNYELANEEWEHVLSLDPSNKEVLDMQTFLKNRSSGQPPHLPGAPAGTAPRAQPPGAGPAAPRAQGGASQGGASQGGASQGSAAPGGPAR